MKKKVIFHIGHAKTATTSIQDTLKENRSILEDNGFLYLLSDNDRNHNKLFITLFKTKEELTEEIAFMQDIGLKKIKRLRRYYGEWFGEKLKNSSAHTFIISGEYFPHFSESELQSIKNYFCTFLGEVEFEVIMFTRDPLSFAQSAHQQRSKKRAVNEVSYFSYINKIPAFISAFGRGHVNAHKLEDACTNAGGPVCFFLEKIGLSEKLIDQLEICRTNEGMSDVAFDVLAYINANIPFKAENVRSGLRRRGDHFKFVRLPGRKFRLPSDYAGDVRAKTKDSMVWLEDTFGIVYEEAGSCQVDSNLVFEDGYVTEMLVALKHSGPVMRKLVYGYIKEKKEDKSLNASSRCSLETIERLIAAAYPWSVRLPYKVLSSNYRMTNPLYEQLRKSRSVRWLWARCKK